MSEHAYPNHQPAIEYHPSPIDRAAGAIGALRMRGQVDLFPQPQGKPDIHALLDDFEASGNIGTTLDPASEAARLLIEQFQLSPRLEQPLFLPEGVQGEKTRLLAVDVDPENPIKLPVSNFVYASTFEDWNKGRAGTRTPGGITSRERIRSYARQATPMPPIGFVSANIQPDGRVLYASIQDGAHRVAAAHLRGDEYIDVGRSVVVHRLSKDILPVRR